tara:strand:- start:98 stop:592 length:495 start_codon:yes stop_codon:yes gene_type:complete
MATLEQPEFNAPIPGMGMTAELGGRPWQVPPQYNTIEEALDYYIPRITSKEFRRKLFDTLELGVPVTTIANTLQLSGVIESKHTVDVGMLLIPVLMEFIMLMADEVNIKYTSGLEEPKKLRDSAIELASSKFEDAMINVKQDVKEKPDEKESKESKGLMAKRGK